MDNLIKFTPDLTLTNLIRLKLLLENSIDTLLF